MRLHFPSPEFDEAVAAVCHGPLSEEQAQALNELLRSDPAARDEYILRAELHARLASDPDLFVAATPETDTASASGAVREDEGAVVPFPTWAQGRKNALRWAVALAACLALLAGGWWGWHEWRQDARIGATSQAVAMLNGVVDAKWDSAGEAIQAGAPLNPGWIRLTSGLAQIVFYSGARVVIEGPAEVQIISPTEASCRVGRLVAEVPPQAKGFRVATPQMEVTDLGTVFGLEAKERATEVHVFTGEVEFLAAGEAAKKKLEEGFGAVAEAGRAARLIDANPRRFTTLFGMEDKLAAAETSRFEKWRASSRRLNEDPSLIVHFDFEHATPSDWRLRNASGQRSVVADGTIVGCQWVEGRWPPKPALEFRSVSDRVRLNVPGSYESVTLATWVRVHGLDRQFNSLFMCDGFDAGTLHWLIREDGVLGLTVIGANPGEYQIVTSRPALGLDQLGRWLHLAVVLDGKAKRVTHYVNGQPVMNKALRIQPPFHVGAAELGNWNGRGFPKDDPFMIRNFSGAMDEFCLFSRALSESEIRALHSSDLPR